MTKYIKGFDALRCYSIVLVVVTHLGVAHIFEEGSYLRDHVFYFFSGAAGVNTFFAISGFLITTLILNEIKVTGSFNIKSFFIRRFLRLLPPVIPFFIAIFFFMKLGYIRETMVGLFFSIFYLFNFVPKAKAFWSTELSHTWSLAVEEQFYVIWAFIFSFLNSKKITFLILILLILCVFVSYFLPSISLTIQGNRYLLEDVFFTMRWTIPAIGPILIGALFAILNFLNWKNITEKIKGNNALLLCLFLFISPFYVPNFLLPILNLFHGLGVAAILLWIANNQSHSIINVLEWKPIKYIGTISYGIYIWQGFFVRTGSEMTPKIWVHDFPQNVMFALLISVVSYEFFEKKILRFKKRFKEV